LIEEGPHVELKTARLTLLIDPHKKAAFERLCALQDRTPSQVVRQLIREYLAAHGEACVGSAEPPDAPPAKAKPKARLATAPAVANRRKRA
jgi:hypothetical protein